MLRRAVPVRPLGAAVRGLCTASDQALRDTVTQALSATHVEVEDVSGEWVQVRSENLCALFFAWGTAPDRRFLALCPLAGGCGSQYRMLVVSPEFEGANMVKQQRMVYEVRCSGLASRMLSVFSALPSLH